MITNIISATVNYADIAFFVLLGLGLIGGIIGGLAKQFKGFLKSIAVILISILIAGATLAPISSIGFIKKLNTTLQDKTSSWGAVFTEPIHTDGTDYYIFVDDTGSEENPDEQGGQGNQGEGEAPAIASADEGGTGENTADGTEMVVPEGKKAVKLEAAGDGLAGKAAAKFAAWLAKRFIKSESDSTSLSALAANMFTSIIVLAATFIIYCIILGIICWILSKLFKKMHDSNSTTVKILDRVFGGVVAAGLMLVFLMLVLAILHTLSGTVPKMHEYLSNSTVVKIFYADNPITKAFAAVFGK